MARLAWVIQGWTGTRPKHHRRTGADRTQFDPPTAIHNNDPLVNMVSGTTSYLNLLDLIHRELAPRLYLEIGVREGASLRLSGCVSIGIDPEAQVSHSLPKEATIYHRTSDDFFGSDAEGAIQGKIDLAFIDGMHKFEFVLRDFINIETYSTSTSLVVVDDIFPNHPAQASKTRHTRVWTGDVWKLLPCLRDFRPDLILVPADTSPTGSLLIAGLDPSNLELKEKYNLILKRFVTDIDDRPPVEVLERCMAMPPDDQRIIELLRLLRVCRTRFPGEPVIRERLAAFAKHLIASSATTI